MTRRRNGYSPSSAHGRTIAKAIAPRVPEYRAERPSVPYTGPVSLEEWRQAFRAMAAADPLEVADMLGQRFTR